MPQYWYRARNLSGEPVTGVLEAPNLQTLQELLSKRKYFLIEAREGKRGFLSKEITLPFLKRVRLTHLILLTRQLATLLRAGIPITQAISTLREQTESPVLREALGKIREDIERGESLGNALSKHPHIFNELYVASIRVGEEAGNVEEILNRLGDFMERELDVKGKVKGALLYPVILLIVATGLITFLVTWVLPKFREVFYSAHVPLPLPTVMMFKLSEFVKNFWFVGLAIVILTFIGLWLFYRTEKGKLCLDNFKLKIPLFGSLLRKVAVSRFARSLETLVRSGVELGRSFQIIKGTIGNEVLARVMDRVRENVVRGGSINEPLRKSKKFPPLVSQMISVGEETGAMEDMLVEIADSYDREVDFSIKILTSVLEPVLLVVMGGIVLFIALSLYLPLFKMAKVIAYY